MQFLSNRLTGRVPLKTMFWRDMVAVGSLLNMAFLATALALASLDWPLWSVFIVFLTPLPYNAFIWHCVWKKVERLDTFSRVAVRTISTGWLALVVFL